jgi:hypothetical protein
LSDIDETSVSQRKPPPEGIMPSLVPHVRRNTVRSTRNALPQPPANVYITSGDGNDSLDLRDKRMLFESERGAPPRQHVLILMISLSITRLPTNTHLHPLLRRQHLRHHHPIPLKTTTMARSKT